MLHHKNNLFFRASPQISFPPKSSETRPPQQRFPSNNQILNNQIIRQNKFDSDVTNNQVRNLKKFIYEYTFLVSFQKIEFSLKVLKLVIFIFIQVFAVYCLIN